MTVQPCGLTCTQCGIWNVRRWFNVCHVCENVDVCRNCNFASQHLQQCEACQEYVCNDCHKDQELCTLCMRNVCVKCVHFRYDCAAVQGLQIMTVCMDCHDTCSDYFELEGEVTQGPVNLQTEVQTEDSVAVEG